MRRWLPFVAALACLTAGCRKPAPQAAPGPGAQALALRAQLAERDFKGLTAELSRRQDAFEKNAAQEDACWTAFEAFAPDDPATEALLDEWVTSSGGGYPALGARASYHEATGWRRRGHATRDKTSEGAFEEMAASFAKAERDCGAALDKNLKLAHCHTLLIRTASTQRPPAEVEERMLLGREAAPASFMVRLAYLQSLTPRWGGSYEQMAAFAQQAAAESGRNPRFRNLAAYIPADQGWAAQLLEKPDAAVRLYSEALAIGEEAAIHAGRAGAYHEQKRPELAARDLARAFELGPEGWHHSNTSLVDALALSAAGLHRDGDQAGAIRQAQRALALDRRDEFAQTMWTYINRRAAQGGRKKR